jgi:hypothetical protein
LPPQPSTGPLSWAQDVSAEPKASAAVPAPQWTPRFTVGPAFSARGSHDAPVTGPLSSPFTAPLVPCRPEARPAASLDGHLNHPKPAGPACPSSLALLGDLWLPDGGVFRLPQPAAAGPGATARPTTASAEAALSRQSPAVALTGGGPSRRTVAGWLLSDGPRVTWAASWSREALDAARTAGPLPDLPPLRACRGEPQGSLPAASGPGAAPDPSEGQLPERPPILAEGRHPVALPPLPATASQGALGGGAQAQCDEVGPVGLVGPARPAPGTTRRVAGEMGADRSGGCEGRHPGAACGWHGCEGNREALELAIMGLTRSAAAGACVEEEDGSAVIAVGGRCRGSDGLC